MELGGGLSQPIVRIQEGIAVELESVAVELVGATLDDGVDDRARVASIFWINGIGNDVEFLQRIQAGNNYGRV